MRHGREAEAPIFAVLTLLTLAAGPRLASAQNAVVQKLEISEDLGWSVGDAEAPLTVVEFTDISCPYCSSFYNGTRASLQAEFVEGGKVRWITLSYVSGLYPNSEALFLGLECAGRQERYDDFLRIAYLDRESWISANRDGVETVLESLADQVSLDRATFHSCRADPSIRERLKEIVALSREVGVRGTPTWFVDGFLVMGDLPHGFARHFITSRLSG
tara:strand:+ start:581 stop:1231 length:651 start_codon:yes stop_codon:yes gene_type:complete